MSSGMVTQNAKTTSKITMRMGMENICLPWRSATSDVSTLLRRTRLSHPMKRENPSTNALAFVDCS